MIYRLYIAGFGEVANAAMTVNQQPEISFLFAPENSDYEAFKVNVLAGAELQDADGNLMTEQQAKDYVATLP